MRRRQAQGPPRGADQAHRHVHGRRRGRRRRRRRPSRRWSSRSSAARALCRRHASRLSAALELFVRICGNRPCVATGAVASFDAPSVRRPPLRASALTVAPSTASSDAVARSRPLSAVGTMAAAEPAPPGRARPRRTTSRPSSRSSARSCSPDRTLYALVVEEGLQRRGLLPRAPPRRSSRRCCDLYGRARADRRPHRHRGAAPDRASSRRPAARRRCDALAGAVPAAGNVRHYAQIVKEQRAAAPPADDDVRDPGERRQPRGARRASSSSRPSGRCSRSPATTARRTSARSTRCSTRRSTSCTSSRSRAPRSPARPRASSDLDEITGGFQPGNLIVIAARPSMGKSRAGHEHRRERRARHTDQPGRAVLAGDVRGRARPALRRLAGAHQGRRPAQGQAWRRATLAEDPQGLASGSPTRRCSSTTPRDIGMLEMRAKARRLHTQLQAEGGLGLIIVDYLQLMRPDDRTESRVEQVGQISRGLKILARELERPGDRALAAQPRGRVAARQAADALRPARVGPDRAGRRPRDVHLPRRVLQRGLRAPGRGRPASSPSTATAASARSRSPSRRSTRSFASLDRHRRRANERALPASASATARGFLVDEETNARPALPLPRPQRISRAQARSLVRRDPEALPRASPSTARRSRTSTPLVGARGAALRAPHRRAPRRRARAVVHRRRRHRQDDAGDARLQGGARRRAARSRSTRCRGCWRRSARPSTTSSERSYLELLDRLTAVDLLHIDDVGAERTARVGARAALLDRQRPLRGRALDGRHDQHRRARTSSTSRSARAPSRA